MGENYQSISSMEKFFFISYVYLYEKKVNSISSESWLDRVGERRTEVEVICTCVGVPVFEGV